MSRYAAATWRASSKHGYPSTDIHLGEGVVIHSMEGSLAAAFGELDKPSREASWHFSVAKDGKVYQHIDSANIAWTNGSFEANQKFWGIENEGVKGEPLSGPQFQSLALLVKWLLGPLPHVRGQTLFEHNEMTAYGASPTACPSGRIPWTALIAAMEENMPLTDADKQWIRTEIANYLGTSGGGHLPNLISSAALDGRLNEVITRMHRSEPHGGVAAKHKHPLSATITGETEEA